MGSEHYCLRWNNHQNNLLGVFSQLLRDETLVDVTLACSEGHSIRAHKVVLSACSSYFQALFVDHPSRHPIVILKDVRFAELRTLIEFMYKGEVNVEYCQLSALLKTAESLKVKGLAEMTRDCKTEAPEQTEPTELTTRKPLHHRHLEDDTPPPLITDRLRSSSSPLRLCKSPIVSEKERSSRSPMNSATPTAPSEPVQRTLPLADPLRMEDDGPSDMTIHNNATAAVSSSILGGIPPMCSRIPSPLNTEALPGTSAMAPVQQVPLSLKKEVDWGGGSEDKNIKDPTDYSRSSQHDSDLLDSREGSPRLYPCMYCGSTFPHQSKLTRHILSHSLDSLRRTPYEATANYLESPFGTPRVPVLAHEPPDPTDQPPTSMDMDVLEGSASATTTSSNSGVVLCKFCGKSFPDVSSLISHLPVHTGDRPFKCEFCGKAFKLRHHMKDHCRVHTGERPFRCALCGKTFSRSTILKAHEKTHYPKYVRKFLSPSPLDTEEDNPH